MIRVWYLTLERIVTPLRVPNAAAAALAKVSLDQIGFAPLFNVVLISIIGLSQVKSISRTAILYTSCFNLYTVSTFKKFSNPPSLIAGRDHSPG